MESTYLWPRAGRRRFGGEFGRSLDSKRLNFVWNFVFQSLTILHRRRYLGILPDPLFFLGAEWGTSEDGEVPCQGRLWLRQNGVDNQFGDTQIGVDHRWSIVCGSFRSWHKLQVELQHQILARMRGLGMIPVRQGLYFNVYQYDRFPKILLTCITWICRPSARCLCGEISRSLLHQADLETIQSIKPVWSVHDQVDWCKIKFCF